MSDERAKEVQIETVDNGYIVHSTANEKDPMLSALASDTHTVHETFASLVEELRERFEEGVQSEQFCRMYHMDGETRCGLLLGHSGPHANRLGHTAKRWKAGGGASLCGVEHPNDALTCELNDGHVGKHHRETEFAVVTWETS